LTILHHQTNSEHW